MEEKTIKTYVKGIYCIQCPQIITSMLLQKRGVINADVEYFKSSVRVKYDPEIVSEEELFVFLAEAGYPHIDRKPTLTEKLSARIIHLFDK